MRPKSVCVARRIRASGGAISVGVFVLTTILLSILLAGFVAAADNLRLIRSKAAYLAEAEKLRSAKLLVEIRLEDFTEEATERAAEEMKEKYPEPPATGEEMAERRKEFQELLAGNFVNGHDLSFQNAMRKEDLGGLAYRVDPLFYEPEERKIFVIASIRPRRSGARSSYGVHYSIFLEEPDQEELLSLWRGEEDVLKQKYKNAIRQEFAYREDQG